MVKVEEIFKTGMPALVGRNTLISGTVNEYLVRIGFYINPVAHKSFRHRIPVGVHFNATVFIDPEIR